MLDNYFVLRALLWLVVVRRRERPRNARQSLANSAKADAETCRGFLVAERLSGGRKHLDEGGVPGGGDGCGLGGDTYHGDGLREVTDRLLGRSCVVQDRPGDEAATM
jgi:hypothetical protein